MTQQHLKVINPYNFSIRNWERLPSEVLLTVENTKHKSNSGGNIPRREGVKVYTKRCSPTLRGIVVLVFTKSVETLVGTLFTIISGILWRAFLRFCCKYSMEIFFYLLVNTDKLQQVAFLVFIGTTASFIAQISSTGKCLKARRLLGSGRKKQWIATDIPSNRSQSKCAKSAIH